MAQFDVFANPISRTRRAYPLVAVLQADLADTGRDRIVAPLAPKAKLKGSAGRLTPHVEVDGTAYVLLVPAMTAIRVDDLRDRKGDLSPYRDAIVAALDFLFLGV